MTLEWGQDGSESTRVKVRALVGVGGVILDPDSDDWRSHDKHFFILSSAGKPIYSHKGDEDKLSTFMGVIQAIISVYIDLDDSIRYIFEFELMKSRCVNAGDYRIVFLVRGPLYFVVVTCTDEPESAVNSFQSLLNVVERSIIVVV